MAASANSPGAKVATWKLARDKALEVFEPIGCQVQGGLVYVRGRVNNMVVSIRIKLSDLRRLLEGSAGSVLAKATTLRNSASAKAHRVAEPVYIKVKGGVVYVRGCVSGTLVRVKAEAASAWGKVASKSLKAYSGAVQAVEGCAKSVKARAVAVSGAAAERAQAACEPCRVVVRKGAVYLKGAGAKAHKILEPYVVKVNGGVVYIGGRVGDAAVCVRARASAVRGAVVAASGSAAGQVRAALLPPYLRVRDGCHAAEARVLAQWAPVRAKLVDAYVRVLAAAGGYAGLLASKVASACDAAKAGALGLLQPLYLKVKDGFLCVKGRVGDSIVYLKTKASSSLDAAAEKMPIVKIAYVKVVAGVVYIKGQMSDSVVYVRLQVSQAHHFAKAQALGAVKAIEGYAAPLKEKMVVAYNAAKTRTLEAVDGSSAGKVAAVSATGGAVALGTSGGAAGLVTGGFIGAACGVVPAIFTFGLSIPVGAAIGSGAGLCVGTVAGGAAGLVGGGAAGLAARRRRASGASGAAAPEDLAQEVEMVKVEMAKKEAAREAGVAKVSALARKDNAGEEAAKAKIAKFAAPSPKVVEPEAAKAPEAPAAPEVTVPPRGAFAPEAERAYVVPRAADLGSRVAVPPLSALPPSSKYISPEAEQTYMPAAVRRAEPPALTEASGGGA